MTNKAKRQDGRRRLVRLESVLPSSIVCESRPVRLADSSQVEVQADEVRSSQRNPRCRPDVPSTAKYQVRSKQVSYDRMVRDSVTSNILQASRNGIQERPKSLGDLQQLNQTGAVIPMTIQRNKLQMLFIGYHPASGAQVRRLPSQPTVSTVQSRAIREPSTSKHPTDQYP